MPLKRKPLCGRAKMRVSLGFLIIIAGCRPAITTRPTPAPDCEILFAAASRGWQQEPDIKFLQSRVGLWTLSLVRSSTHAEAKGLATIWTGYTDAPRELIGSHGVSFDRLDLLDSSHDGSLQLWQLTGDTIAMHIGSAFPGEGIGLYAVGAGIGSVIGCWIQVRPDSTGIDGYFRLDPRDGPAT